MKDRASQLLIKYKSGALVTQFWHLYFVLICDWILDSVDGDSSIFQLLPKVFLEHDHPVDDDGDDYDYNDNDDDDDGDVCEALWLLTNT